MAGVLDLGMRYLTFWTDIYYKIEGCIEKQIFKSEVKEEPITGHKH